MTVREWRKQTENLPPELPIIFCNDSGEAISPEEYGDVQAIEASRYWDARLGWCPCLVVLLGREW